MKVLLRFPNNAPKAALVLFPGGQGEGHFAERNGQIRVGNNFLTRTSPLFVERGFAVAIVDVPSDQAGGISDQFRTGKEHIQDIKKVIDLVSQKWPGPLYLVGTSRGTLSVGSLGASLQDRRVSGIVLTSSIGASRPSRLDRLSRVTISCADCAGRGIRSAAASARRPQIGRMPGRSWLTSDRQSRRNRKTTSSGPRRS